MTHFTTALITVMEAHALGYWDGRAHGCNERDMDAFTDDEAVAYKLGYDKGVADYSELDVEGSQAA